MRRLPGKTLVAAAWISILILPSLVWILMDQSVWPWDPGYYGYWSVRIARDGQSFHEWFNLTFNALKYMPPLIVWLGQIFVPLRHLTGEVESALLLLILCGSVGTLVLVFLTAQDCAADQGTSPRGQLLIALTATGICGSASMFIGLSHVYFTEILQAFAAALSMYVALHAERRSLRRNVALVMLMVALAFSVKASSLTFVLPALVYVALALAATPQDSRPPAQKSDVLWLVLSAALLAMALYWYVLNWSYMALHFVQATVGAEVQNYAAPSPVSARLKYWILSTADAFSPVRAFAVVLGLIILAGLGIALSRIRLNSGVLRTAVTSGTLYGLYLAGMSVATILSYALQINEDPRYMIALLPLLAGLAGWALAALRTPGLAAPVLLACAVNAAVIYASTLGLIAPLNYRWLWTFEKNTENREILTRIVAATCRNQADAPLNLMGVSYAYSNPNNANFYGAKRTLETGEVCQYAEMPAGDASRALAWLDEAQTRYVVTVAPDLQDPVNFANPISKPFAEGMAQDARFELMPESFGRFQLYHRIK